MKVVDKVALGAGVVALVTSPLSGQYILKGLDWGFQQIFIRGAYVNLVATGVVILYMGYKMWLGRDKNIIPKNIKTKTQKYIET